MQFMNMDVHLVFFSKTMIKKTIIFFLLYVFCIATSDAQISVSVDSITIYSVNIKIKKNVDKHFRTDLSDGPTATFHISICNESNQLVSLNYDSISFGYMFYYNSNIHIRKLFQFVRSFDEIILQPMDTFTISFYPTYLLTINARKENDYNYSRYIANILPSVKCFIIINNQLISSDSCGSVRFIYGYENDSLKERPPKRLKKYLHPQIKSVSTTAKH